MSLFVFFISLLIVAQCISGNHVPIIRSWRLRGVIASCWYVPWLREGCQDRLTGSASTSFLLVAQHVSGNHMSIIRSWRLRDVIDLCWYVPWLRECCQDRLAGSASIFISLLIVAQHVSGNHVPIIRSWRLRDVIALCWYVPWVQEGGQVRLAGSASMDALPANRTWQPLLSNYITMHGTRECEIREFSTYLYVWFQGAGCN